MPSLQATALTQRHRAELGRVATLASRQMTALVKGADPVDIDAWWESVAVAALRIVMLAAGNTATLAVRYLLRHAGLERVRVQPVRAVPPVEQVETSLFVMGPVAFKSHIGRTGSESSALRVMFSQLAGTASSRALDGDRDTVMATFAERDRMVGWRRKTRGDACAFCLMLASRGAVYSKGTVDFVAHKPRCFCTPEPLWRHEPEPPEVLRLRRQWDTATAGYKGRDALNAFRRSVYAQRSAAARSDATPEPASS